VTYNTSITRGVKRNTVDLYDVQRDHPLPVISSWITWPQPN